MADIAIMGHGVVGSGVTELLTQNRDMIEEKAGECIRVKYILDRKKDAESPHRDKFVKDFALICEDDDIRLVVETMGGLHPAYDYVKACLERGKSVVTSNKELVAAKGGELLAVAAAHQCHFLFEASVGGGIPIIHPLRHCLGANHIVEIAGILNGTTNFILTQMFEKGDDFDSALREAQGLGYAERDPTADVEGHDSGRKISILAALAFGIHLSPLDIPTQGITALTGEDVAYAAAWGGAIKLIARAGQTADGQVYARVAPTFVSRESQLAGVKDVFNAVMVRGDAVGDVLFYGRGAGKMPTASAVVSDIIEALREKEAGIAPSWRAGVPIPPQDREKMMVTAYIRACGPAAKQAARTIFGEVTPLSRPGAPVEEYAFITPSVTEKALADGMDAMEAQGVKRLQMLRVDD